MASGESTDREIVVSRLIEGPRPLIFAAYSEVRHLSQWYGPTGFTTTTHSFDFRPGGVWEFTMHGPEGTDYPNHVEYLEIYAAGEDRDAPWIAWRRPAGIHVDDHFHRAW